MPIAGFTATLRPGSLIVGGEEWGCTGDTGRVLPFYRQLNKVTVVNESTVLLNTQPRQLHDCFKKAHVTYR